MSSEFQLEGKVEVLLQSSSLVSFWRSTLKHLPRKSILKWQYIAAP